MSRAVVIRLDGDPRGLLAALNRVDANIAKSEHRAQRFGKVVGGALAVGGLARGLESVVKTAGDFDTTLREAGSAANANAKQIHTLGEAARAAGVKQKVGAEQAATAQRELARAGLTVKQIIGGGMVAALNLAAASGEDVANTSAVVANALNAFGLSGRDASKVADQLTISANATTSSVGDTGLALSQASAAAKTAGLSLTDTNTALTALAKLGVRGSDAGTSLKTALVHLVKPNKQAKETMHELGLSFFDAHGNMKSIVDIAGMLESKLGGLNRKQREQALATIAGTDGFRTLIALYDLGAKGASGLEHALQKQGVAAKQAAQRNAGTGGAIREASAAWTEAKLKIADVAAPTIAKELQKFSKAVEQADKNGDLKQMLGDLGTGLETVATLGEGVATVGGGIAHVWAQVPKPLRDAAAAMLLVSVAARRLGASSGAAAAGAVAEAAAGRRIVATAPVGGGILSRGGAMLGRVRVSGAGVGALAGGALGAASSGGNIFQAALTGGAAGSIGGPWGAAGGAIAAAAGVGLHKLFEGQARADAHRLGEEIANGAGAGLSKSTQSNLAALKKAADEAQRKNETSLGGRVVERGADRGNAKANSRAQDALGAATGNAYVNERLKGLKFINTTSVIAELRQRTEGMTREARTAAAKPVAAYLRELEKQGRLSKGASDRFLDQIGVSLKSASKKPVTVGVKYQLKLEEATRGSKNSLEKTLKRQEGEFQNLRRAADTSTHGIVTTAHRRMGELAKIMHGSTGATAKERAAAAHEYAALARAIDRFKDDAQPALQKYGSAADLYIGSGTHNAVAKAKQSLEELSPVLASIAYDINHTLSKVDPSKLSTDQPTAPGAGPGGKRNLKKKKPAHNRGGGLNFGGGGMVPIVASPGELAVEPSGRSYMVPGVPVAADTVPMAVPSGTAIYTGHGQALLAAGASPSEALAKQLPHFAAGGKVTGKVSWFGGPGDSSDSGRTALGVTTATPGVAVRPGSTWQSGRATLGGYWDVHVGGHHSVLQQTDLGPNQSTGRRIDVTYSALPRLGFSQKNFPTNSTGWAAYLGKGRQTAIARAAAGKTSGSYVTPIILGKSTAGRGPIVADAFSQGYSLGSEGYTSGDLRKYGNPILGQISSALGSGRYTRTVEGQSSSLGSKATGGLSTAGVTPIKGVDKKLGLFGAAFVKKFGLSVTSTTGGGHADGSYHYRGMAIDVAGKRMKEAAYWLASSKKRYGLLLEGIHNPGLSVKNHAKVPQGFWGKSTWAGHKDHIHLAMRRGGVVGRFRRGGLALGGVNVSAGLASGGPRFYEALGMAADDAAYKRLEKTLAALRRVADGGGDARVVARATAAMAVLDNAMGLRVGRAVSAATSSENALQTNLSATNAVQRIRGIDPNSARGIAGQQLQYQRFIDNAPNVERQLKIAQARAERRAASAKTPEEKAAAKQTLDSVTQQINEFGTQVLNAKADLADLGRAAAQAALDEQRAKRVSFQGADDFQAAMARLTETTDDDAKAQQDHAAHLKAALDQALAAGDSEQATDLANQLADLNETMKAANTSAQEQLDATKEQTDLLRQVADGQAAIQRLVQSQQPAKVLAALVNTGLGGGVFANSGFPVPGGSRW